jgi:hypothetical protein
MRATPMQQLCYREARRRRLAGYYGTYYTSAVAGRSHSASPHARHRSLVLSPDPALFLVHRCPFANLSSSQLSNAGATWEEAGLGGMARYHSDGLHACMLCESILTKGA